MTNTAAEAPAPVPTGVAEPKSNDDFEPEPTPAAATDQGNPDLGDAGKQAIDRMKADKVAAEKRAKAAEKELTDLRKAAMGESEKALHEAETRGRQAAAAEYGKRLARASFDAMAAKRNPEVATDEIVEFVDMARFLNEDGDIDATALQSAVDRLVPAIQTGPPAFDGGARGASAPSDNMNDLIRRQAFKGRIA